VLIPDKWTSEIIGAAINVHRHLGPGLFNVPVLKQGIRRILNG